MAFVFKDRVQQYVTSLGTGTLSLGNAVAAQRKFSNAFTDNDQVLYVIEGTNNEYEVGIGTYSGEQLTRDTVLISSSGSSNPIYTGPNFVVANTLTADYVVAKNTDGFAEALGFKAGTSGIIYSDGTQQVSANAAATVTGPQSGVAFYGSNTSISGDAYLRYDFNNFKLYLGNGGLVFQDNTTQTTAYTGVDLSSYATSSDLLTVSGLLYSSWSLNGDNISSTETVTVTGVGSTTVTYDAGTNTLTVSGADTGETYAAGSGLELAGNTFNAKTATTSSAGITTLQDSATNGTTNKAITPNAVYDISGNLQASIDAKDNYSHWVLKGDGATTTQVNTTEQVALEGAGSVSISLGGTDNRTVTISGATAAATPAGSTNQIQYNNGGTLGASEYLSFDSTKITLHLGSGGNIGIGEGVFSGITPVVDNVAIGRYASWDALDTHDRTTFVGAYAGANTSLSTNSDDAVGIGANALQGAISGVARAIAIGSSAYSGASSMYDSVAIGYAAGQGSVNQNYGVFIGREAGRNAYRAVTQTHAIGLGYRALDGMLDGQGNIGIGRESLTGVDGSYNINIGYRGGYDTVGERNIVFGFQAGRYINGRNNYYFGDSAGNLTTGDYNLEMITDPLNRAIINGNWSNKINIDNVIHGDSSAQTLQVGNVDGTLSPNGTLEVLSSNANSPVLIVQGATSQVDNLQEWQDVTLATVASVDPTGGISGSSVTFADGTTQTTAYTGQVGGGGTLDGGGSANQLAYWTSSTALSGDSALVILPNSGLSGSLIQTEQLQFATSGNLSLSNTNGTSIVSVSDSGTGIVFEVLDTGNQEIFTVVDNGDTTLQLTASVSQTANVIEVRDSSNVLVASIGPGGDITFGSYSDATRPSAGNAGRVIFNTTDGNLNIDNGTNWILPDGTTT